MAELFDMLVTGAGTEQLNGIHQGGASEGQIANGQFKVK